MIKKMTSMMLLGFCGAVLTTSMLCGQEATSKEDHVPVGTRSVSLTEHVAQQETRAKLSDLNMQENGLAAEEVQVAANEQLETAQIASQTDGSERVVQHAMFYTSHPGAFHRAAYVGIFGDSIEFEDGSIWSIYAGDAYRTLNWLPSDLIVVTPNRSWFSVYNYRLTNQNTGVAVEANLTLGPIYNSLFTHWIVAIDYYHDIIYLEDGTVWNMSCYDGGVIQKWVVNDTVIIGINDGWLSSSRPNILINVNMNNYATGIVAY